VAKNKQLIIIPTYNEKENITTLIERLLEEIPSTDILVVDDQSPDGTSSVVENTYKDDPRISVMNRTGIRGLGRSYVDGYIHAVRQDYDRVAQMDADMSHDPKYLPRMFSEAAEYDLVIGSRYCPDGGVENWPYHRYLLSRFANSYVASITGLRVTDATSGFRVYTRAALNRIPLERIHSNGYAFQVEMTFVAFHMGLKIVESPIVFTDRRLGKSKISRKVMIESMIMPWRLRFGRSMHDIQKSVK
jgi:dolichol-phosphate mannosyltransferase